MRNVTPTIDRDASYLAIRSFSRYLVSGLSIVPYIHMAQSTLRVDEPCFLSGGGQVKMIDECVFVVKRESFSRLSGGEIELAEGAVV